MREFSDALSLLLSNADWRSRFEKDATLVATQMDLRPEDWPPFLALNPHELSYQSDVLLKKRFHEMKQSFPKWLRPRLRYTSFSAYAAMHWPTGHRRHRQDALRFAGYLMRMQAMRFTPQQIRNNLAQRFQDLILSIYLYNEKRGYTEVERLAETLPAHGFEPSFIEEVRKHATDEKAHYELFRNYFKESGRAPYEIGSLAGYFDRAFKNIWGKWTWEVELASIVSNRKQFSRLCRTIALAELRGIQQVNWVLRLPWVNKNPAIRTIFERVKRDEPSHVLPYRRYLRRWDRDIPTAWERVCDLYVHLTLSYLIVPVLFLNPGLKRQPTGISATLTGLASAPSSFKGNATIS